MAAIHRTAYLCACNVPELRQLCDNTDADWHDIGYLPRKKFPEVLRTGILCVAVLGVGVLLYMKLSHIIYPNIDNETYGGVGNMGQIAVRDMPVLIGRCYKRFLEYFLWKPFAFVSRTAQTANVITCVLAVVLLHTLRWSEKCTRTCLHF